MEYFKAITLRPFGGREAHTIVEVAAGGDGFNNRWLVLQPHNISGSYLLPGIDADHVITTLEAARALSVRRGWPVPVTTVRRYLARGTLSVAGRLPDKRGTWLLSREDVWTFEFPEAGNPNWIREYRERQQLAQEATDE